MFRSLWRIFWAIKYRVSFLKLLTNKDAAGYYTTLGDDVIESLNENFQEPSKPLWFNLGYWKEANTYPQACIDMATLLGNIAELQPTDNLLDVGCGFAEQDMVWVNQFDVAHILGIDITPIHVEVAKKRIKERNLEHRIELRIGSATELDVADAQFDKVIALECAFHFRTRETFFREAFRVLKPGGRLITADMLPEPGENFSGFFKYLERRQGHVPEENMYDRLEYKQKLQNLGFRQIQVKSIPHYVYPGMAQYIEKRVKEKLPMEEVVVELTKEDIDQCKGKEIWQKHLGISDYITASAMKP